MTGPLFARTRWVEGGSPDGKYRLGRIEGWPCAGYITTLFGTVSATHPRGHSGVDIGGVGDTTPVHAPAAGTVLLALEDKAPGWDSWTGIFGASVVLEHAEHVSLYAHLSAVMVKQGQVVQVGHRLGTTGNTGFSTGAHLHWGVAPKANRWFRRAEGGFIDPLSLVVDARAAAAAGGLVHTVVRGDTLGEIAARYGVTVADLVALNGLADPNRIAVGQVLTVRRASAGPSPAPAPPPPAPVTPSAPAVEELAQLRTLLEQARRDVAQIRGTAEATVQRIEAVQRALEEVMR